MKKPEWFERTFQFGFTPAMLPFFLERLEGTIARLEQKLKGRHDDLLSYQPQGKWCVKQHVGHLAEVDEIALRRIDEMVNGVSPLSPAVFEPRKDYVHKSAGEVLAYFADSRIKNLSRYKTLSEADCTRASLHPRLKVLMNPVDLAFFDAEHDDHHLVKIGEILETFRS